jgi:hypothetical protein
LASRPLRWLVTLVDAKTVKNDLFQNPVTLIEGVNTQETSYATKDEYYVRFRSVRRDYAGADFRDNQQNSHF